MTAPSVGEVLAGKYRVERVLGQGGMGVVVQAMHLQLDERVAVKFLLPEYAQHPEASARFLREARAAVKIKSEHVARVIDVGTLDSGAPYMVMEYLKGHDLSEALQASGPLVIDAAVEHVLQACEALAEAHAAGIVHRDLKPANLFLTSRADGSATVKVLDFGISKVTQQTDSGPDMSLTKTSSMMGSPLYMSPEQMRSSRTVDARTDIWSLGAILFELLTGRTPFTGESLPEVCTQILADPPPSLRGLRPEVPAELELAVLRCLEKNRDNRFQSVAELAAALAPFSPRNGRQSAERAARVLTGRGSSIGVSASSIATARQSVSAVSVGTQSAPGTPAAGTVAAWGQTGSNRPEGPSRGLIIATLSAVFVLGAGAAGVLLMSSRDDDTGAAAADVAAVKPTAPPAAAAAPTAPVPASEPPTPQPKAAVAPSQSAVAPEPAASVAPAPVVRSRPAAKPVATRVKPPRTTAKPPAQKPAAPAPAPRGTDLFGARK